MNFYTSNFKAFHLAIIFFSTIAVLFSATFLALKFYVDFKTSKNSFIEEVASKHKHMELNKTDNKFDIVFVGNSHVSYHISTKIFKDHGYSIYNLGVSGTRLFNFYGMSEHASRNNARVVILSLPVQYLYEYSGYHDIAYNDLIQIYGLSAPYQTKINATYGYLKQFNAIRTYADSINQRITDLYQKFSPVRRNKDNNAHSADLHLSELHQSFKENVRCKVFKKTMIHPNVWSHSCKNGDLVMEGLAEGLPEIKEHRPLGKQIPELVVFLNNIARDVKANGVDFYVLLEPHSKIDFDFDLEQLKRSLDAKIIDMSDFTVPQDMWGNNGHLNHIGRLRYSETIAQKLPF